MTCHNPGCLGDYDFDRISFYARKRFIEGCDTVTLLSQAGSEREKEEIALVCLLSVEDNVIQDLELSCVHACTCMVTNCRTLIKSLIEAELAQAVIRA
ncbi:MAG: hypothetical protein HZB57_11465 [Gammaproteobacteria bacterium]|nr:hypothetical protein [Gammaproteobacteria bacterium]